MFSILLFLFFRIPAHSVSPLPERGLLQIEIDNVQPGKGMIWVGLYHSESDFLNKEKAILRGVVAGDSAHMTIQIPDLPYGPYAMAIFQDENNNGKLDRNLFGIPAEPFAFSRPPQSKFRLPRFEEIQFEFRTHRQRLHTRLEKWWKW